MLYISYFKEVLQMKGSSSIVDKFGAVLSKAALSLALTTSNATCVYISHQPEEPKGLAKFKKQ
jgi:cyclic lactone autoinducer peptide